MDTKTMFICDHINKEVFDSTLCDTTIEELIKKSLETTQEFDYIQNRRPDPVYYRKLLMTSGHQNRKTIIAHAGTNKEQYQIADEDICILLNDSEYYNELSKHPQCKRHTTRNARCRDLEMCLGLFPQLSIENANIVLAKFLGTPPLHLRNPYDAIFAFILRGRNSGGNSSFSKSEDQYEFLSEMLSYMQQLASTLKDVSNTTSKLKHTRHIVQSFYDIEPGNIKVFKEWLSEMYFNWDYQYHYYARTHFGENLKKIARGNDSSRIAAMTAAYVSELEKKGQATLESKQLSHMDINVLIESTYSSIEHKNSLFASRNPVNENNELTASINTGFEGYTKKQSELYAIDIITDSIGLDFYNMWHYLGICYLNDVQGNVSPEFGESAYCRGYYLDLLKRGTDFPSLLSTHMIDEPRFLSCFRDYAAKLDTNSPIRIKAEAIWDSMYRFESLMDSSSILQYVTSDWHYACIIGSVGDRFQRNKCLSDNSSLRIARISSKTDKVFDSSRTDIADTPRSLLILSELARIQASRYGQYTKTQLIDHMNRMLSDCGYALLDVRKHLDYIFYAAMRIAETNIGTRQFEFDHIIGSIQNLIKSYVFQNPICKDILKQYDFNPRSSKRSDFDR